MKMVRDKFQAARVKYRERYNSKVLPQKSVTANTLESYKSSLKVFDAFTVFRERANNAVLHRDERASGTVKQEGGEPNC